jgi:CRISPR-associated DxTHG motif protein
VEPSTALSYAILLHGLNFLPVVATGLVASWLVLWRPREARG